MQLNAEFCFQIDPVIKDKQGASLPITPNRTTGLGFSHK